jgi:nickel transport protein
VSHGALAQLASLLALAATPALAHEVLHEVRPGAGVAVRVYESDGEVAGAPFQVWSPGDPRTPYATGTTDRHGWLAFVPDAPGAWRLRVVEDDGHGLDVRVQVAPGSLQAVTVTAREPGGGLLGPLLGAIGIGAVFALLAFRRRRAQVRPAR